MSKNPPRLGKSEQVVFLEKLLNNHKNFLKSNRKFVPITVMNLRCYDVVFSKRKMNVPDNIGLIDLKRMIFRGVLFESCEFHELDLSDTKFIDCRFSNCIFDNTLGVETIQEQICGEVQIKIDCEIESKKLLQKLENFGNMVVTIDEQ